MIQHHIKPTSTAKLRKPVYTVKINTWAVIPFAVFAVGYGALAWYENERTDACDNYLRQGGHHFESNKCDPAFLFDVIRGVEQDYYKKEERKWNPIKEGP